MTDTSGNGQPTDPTAAAPAAPAQPVPPAAPVPPATPGAPGGFVPPAPQPPRKKVPLAVKIIVPVVSLLVAFGAYWGVRAAFDALSGPSKQMLIEKGVEEALDTFDPPRQIDEVTVLTDVTAEHDAIHYHYTLVDVDPSVVTQEVLEGVVLPGLCSTKETRQVLDQDIAMKYTYTVESTGDVYAMEFTKSDC
ncbi:MAG TPA: hypothetical protein VL043_01535 [Protaetiibacter sp.]|nr:hypothetical protein [Protaetiibacter sp.]